MQEPTPWKIHIPDDQIKDLRDRLQRTRWPDEVQGSPGGWDYGSSLAYVRRLTHYWLEDFDWREAEAVLNSHFQHFKLHVNGIDLHFVHHKSKHDHAIPLLLLHGWPGSFIEFQKLLPKLIDPGPGKQAFHVVAPSLPGFGFSSAPQQPGFGMQQMACTFNSLMQTLHYSKYVAQGGDWGGWISKAIGLLFPESCLAIHVNIAFAAPTWWHPLHWAQLANALLPVLRDAPLLLTAREVRGVRATKRFLEEDTGYQKIQGTKPQTLGFAMTDSPAGLAAWIVEKLHDWTDCKGSVEKSLSMDWMLTNISIYWFSKNITSGFRLYKEAFGDGERPLILGSFCKVPTAVAMFPGELYQPPRSWASHKYNIKRWTEFDKGGHFGAIEEPDLLAADVQEFFAELMAQGSLALPTIETLHMK